MFISGGVRVGWGDAFFSTRFSQISRFAKAFEPGVRRLTRGESRSRDVRAACSVLRRACVTVCGGVCHIYIGSLYRKGKAVKYALTSIDYTRHVATRFPAYYFNLYRFTRHLVERSWFKVHIVTIIHSCGVHAVCTVQSTSCMPVHGLR